MLHAQTGVTAFQDNMEAMKHNFLLKGFYKNRGYEDSSALEANKIGELPQVAPLKTFTFTAKLLFETRASAKLKDQKILNVGGNYLAQNQYGLAVVVVSAGSEGDTQKELVLSEARAMVVREYLVENFGFDDTQLKTMGIGKQNDANQDADWGSIQILIFPVGTEIPAYKLPPTGISSTTTPDRPTPVTAASTNKP
jgi:outer membrane protein OmpA-like peptidoglycan-associated protein